MNTDKIHDENGHGFTRIHSMGKVVDVNPVDFYKTYQLNKTAIDLRDILNAKDPFLTSKLDDSFFIKEADKMLIGFFDKFENTDVPENLLKVLETTKKKDQIKLLKGMEFSPGQLMSLIFKSYSDYGYLYSKYVFENIPAGFEDKKLPELFHLKEDNSIVKVGETDLTDGQLRQVIENRKVIVSHFFSKEDIWHCLFLTYNSIAGKENWKNGQAHYHYISSSFGVSKDEFIESMESGKYKSTPVHLDLLDYGNQTPTGK